MNTDFKILAEEFIDYNNKEYMSLMMIREYDKYSVEVISKTMSHGRIYMTSKEEAKVLFEALHIKINKLNSFGSSSEMLKLIKKAKNLRAAMLIFEKNLNKMRLEG